MLLICVLLYVHFLSQTYWQEAQERLELVLCGKPADPALPLVVVVPQVAHDGLSQAEVAARLDIQQYVVNRLVLDVHWIFVNLPHRYSSIDGILPNLLEKVSFRYILFNCVFSLTGAVIAQCFKHLPDVSLIQTKLVS